MKDELEVKDVIDGDEKTFTQEEVNKIIADRLKRAKTPEDYTDLSEISKLMEEFGFTGTPTEKSKAIKDYIASSTKPKEEVIEDIANTGELPDEAVLRALAKKFGTTPEKLEKSIKKSIEQDDAEQAKIDSDKKWAAQIEEFEEKYTDVNVEELNADKKFLKFAKNRYGMLVELYEEYLEFLDDTTSEIAQKVKKSEDRSTGGGGSTTGGSGLSKEQQSTLEEWNRKNPSMRMSAKEFKEYLGG
jgi:hypothetical protein